MRKAIVILLVSALSGLAVAVGTASANVTPPACKPGGGGGGAGTGIACRF